MRAIKLRITQPPREKSFHIPPALIVFGLLICVACGWLGRQVAGPLEQATKLHNENDALERNVRRADIRNQEALKQVEALKTEQGAIDSTRSKGYMFQNERPLRIQNEGAK